MPKHFLPKKSTQKIMKATLSRLLSSKFEKSVIQPFTWYHSRFVPLSGTGNLPWPLDYLLYEQFTDSWMKMPRYQSSPTSSDLSFFLSVFSSSEVLAKITSIRSKLPTATCWSRKKERKLWSQLALCRKRLRYHRHHRPKSFIVFFARWGVKFDRRVKISARRVR